MMSNKKLADALNMTEEEIDVMYKKMFKITEMHRQVNCGSCGYNTCEQMLAAIILGTKSREECSYYNDILAKMASLNEFISNIRMLLQFINKSTTNFNAISRELDKYVEELDKVQSDMINAYNSTTADGFG